MEGVTKDLTVKITSLMGGRANGKEGHRGHSKQWGQGVQSLLHKYVPPYNASGLSLLLQKGTGAERTAELLGRGGEMKSSQKPDDSMRLRLLFSALELNESDRLKKVTSLLALTLLILTYEYAASADVLRLLCKFYKITHMQTFCLVQLKDLTPSGHFSGLTDN